MEDRRELVLKYLRKPDTKLSHAQILKRLKRKEKARGKADRQSLSSHLASLLYRLMMQGVLEYDKSKTKRGGYLYRKATLADQVIRKLKDDDAVRFVTPDPQGSGKYFAVKNDSGYFEIESMLGSEFPNKE